MMKQQHKEILFWILAIVHMCFVFGSLILPFVVTNPMHVKLLLIAYLLVIVQWKFNKYCFLTEWEHYLNPKLVPDKNWSYLFVLLDSEFIRQAFVVSFMSLIVYLLYRVIYEI
jgi:hypothetical protein